MSRDISMVVGFDERNFELFPNTLQPQNILQGVKTRKLGLITSIVSLIGFVELPSSFLRSS